MIETLLQKSGLREVLGELKTKGETEAGTVNTTLEHYQLDVQALMADLTRELERIPMGSGAEVKYTPEAVRRQVNAIARSVGEVDELEVRTRALELENPGFEKPGFEKIEVEKVEVEKAGLEKIGLEKTEEVRA